MGEITLADTTNNALKVELATRIEGENTTEHWLETNSRGYLLAKGKLVSVTSSTAATDVHNLDVDTEVVSIYNPGPVRVWMSAGETVASGGAPIPTAIPIEPGLTVTIPVHTNHNDDVQFSFMLGSGSTAVPVSVLALGNTKTTT